MKIALYPLYHMGMAAQGNILSMIVFTVIVVAAFVIAYLILARSFLKLATANRGAVKSAYKEQSVKVKSVRGALLQKEFSRFTSSANYMLNCGLGVILMPVSAAVLAWKADLVREFSALPAIQECIPLLAIATICLLMTMNDMAAPSISMEGKTLWIVQSLPVSGKQVLLSKLKLPLLLTWISAIPLVIVVEWLIKPSLLNGILIPAAACFYAVLMAEIGLVLNLKMPNLHWTSEIIPLKQSAPVTIALLGGWLIIVALAGIYVLLKNAVSVTTFGILLCAVLLIAAGWLYHWLMTKGTKIFEAL